MNEHPGKKRKKKSHPGTRRDKSLTILKLNAFEDLYNPPQSSVVPGIKLCVACFIELKKTCQPPEVVTGADDLSDSEVGEPSGDGAFSSPEKDTSFVDVNNALINLEESPLKTGQLKQSSRKIKEKQKLVSATKKLKRKMEATLDVHLESSESEDETDKADLKSYRAVQQELKEKFNNSTSYAERVQILTLSPFKIERTMKEFGATNYLVKKSRAVKKQKGILGLCDKNKGKALIVTKIERRNNSIL